MNKHLLGIVAVLILVFTAVAMLWKNHQRTIVQQPPQPPVWVQPPTIPPAQTILTPDQAVETLTAAELKKHLTYLASDELEGRMSGKKGNIVAFEYLKKFHENNGIDTEYQRFGIRRMNPGPKNERGDDFTQNLYAYFIGSHPTLKNEVVVLGAHGDHIGYGPSMSRSRQIAVHNGADDNGSGTVVIQLVAEAFSKLDPKEIPRTLVIQHYSAEEMGLIGSKYYCNNPTFPKNNAFQANKRAYDVQFDNNKNGKIDPHEEVAWARMSNHVAMVNLDMVGYLGKGRYFAGFHLGESSIDLKRIVNGLNTKYNFASQITSHGSGGSDHANFYNKRVPVAFLHTGGHSRYHTPSDDVEHINFDGMEKVAKYTFELVHQILNANVRPQFNNADFKEMPTIHDHGHPEVKFNVDSPLNHSYHQHEFKRLNGPANEFEPHSHEHNIKE